MSVTINDEDGNPCTSPSAQQQRWRRHFSRVLNMQSQFNPQELEKVRQHSLRTDLTWGPTMRELTKALGSSGMARQLAVLTSSLKWSRQLAVTRSSRDYCWTSFTQCGRSAQVLPHTKLWPQHQRMSTHSTAHPVPTMWVLVQVAKRQSQAQMCCREKEASAGAVWFSAVYELPTLVSQLRRSGCPQTQGDTSLE